MNDGKPDRELYRDPNWQLNDKWSLETDTASYFLTVNTNVSSNLRLVITANNVSGTSLTPDAYFMYTAGKYFKDRLNAGYAVNVGEYLYSSSYDKGEGYTSTDIVTNFSNCVPTYGANSFTFSNLNVYNGPSAPSAKFKIAVSGNQINQRRFFAKINSDSILSGPVDFFNYTLDSTTFSLNSLNGTNDVVSVFNYTSVYPVGCPVSDRMVIHKYEITYPRNFNFNGQSGFEFSLAANVAGNYLQITNFNNGTSVPVLYDLTNGKRYLADLSSAPTLKFVLEPSLTTRNLVLVNEDAGNINSVATLQTRNFINYTDASNQGDYIIISNPILFAGAGGSNPVDDYRGYRSSPAGGGYSAKTYLIEEIIDQFGFGIKKNPAGIRNFLLYARNKFAVTPRHVFIIGRGMLYTHQRANESNPDVDKLNLVPTFGSPASDVLLVAEPGSSQPSMSIGRLSVINPAEVATYLKKVKDFEGVQATQSPLIKDKAWTKNVVHIVGASYEALDAILSSDLNRYRTIIRDTLFGANVTSFNKTSPDGVSQLNSAQLDELFSEGINLITYFGHSSATTMEFNLDNPLNYNNYQKYPMFIAMGCNAGAFFNYSTTRLQVKETISENYVLAPDRGTIGFIASTHFGIVHYLDIWAERLYRQAGYKNYGKSIGELLKTTAADVFSSNSQEDFYARCNIEQTEYHGDPAIRLNSHSKPDYVIEDSMLKINPAFVSVADSSFKVTADFLNIGKSPDSPVVIEIKRELPDKSIVLVRRDTIPGIRYNASISVNIPIDPTKGKGLNKLTVTIDPDNTIDELFENNNAITKEVMIFEDEIRPIYPYNYAIVNKPTIKLIASTANPFSQSKEYRMEMDTTEEFNSSFKVVKTITQDGGIIEFDPGITFTDNTVYYWRVAPQPTSGPYSWNTASFVYLANSDVGFNQSHFYQHLKSQKEKISLDADARKWNYETSMQNLFIRQGTWASSSGQQTAFSVAVNSEVKISIASWFQSLVFNIFDPVTFKPWKNKVVTPAVSFPDNLGEGLYNSLSPQNFSQSSPLTYNFEFRYTDTSSRRKIMDFMRDVIPNGAYVVVRNFTLDPASFGPPGFPIAYSVDWAKDTALHGSQESIYHYLKNAGLAGIDSFYRARPFALVYKKGEQNFTPKWIMGDGVYDNPTLSVDCPTVDTVGFITSPKFGPAKGWKQLNWYGATIDGSAGDNPQLNILGYNNQGQVDTLYKGINITQQTLDISSIDASKYPFLQIKMRNIDSIHYTPYQLDYWRFTYVPVPEGAITPNIYFSMTDTVDVAEPLDFKMAFKNISPTSFSDSIKVKAAVIDRNNRTYALGEWRQRSLGVNPDTLHVHYDVDTRQFEGANSLYVEVNPDNDQPEQYHFNNFFYKNFYVRPDTLNPILDVTFDNVHILNHDIVSAKPHIMIKLKDEAKWFLLSDTSTVSIQVRFPDGNLVNYHFDGVNMEFLPAQQSSNRDNTATVNLKPHFDQDGEYELIVRGKDMSGNNAGSLQYRVAFQIYNKPMISNMLNYPNPFTTSTAFVFTVTGGEVPQNIRIQILTVTGKVVREITKDELGSVHIGRNITEFKWDGTDQYGQKLANGVYLYRVVTNLNGKALDKFTDAKDNTDKYFNKGYGKMYLMR
jgi:hypothetical protein